MFFFPFPLSLGEAWANTWSLLSITKSLLWIIELRRLNFLQRFTTSSHRFCKIFSMTLWACYIGNASHWESPSILTRRPAFWFYIWDIWINFTMCNFNRYRRNGCNWFAKEFFIKRCLELVQFECLVIRLQESLTELRDIERDSWYSHVMNGCSNKSDAEGVKSGSLWKYFSKKVLCLSEQWLCCMLQTCFFCEFWKLNLCFFIGFRWYRNCKYFNLNFGWQRLKHFEETLKKARWYDAIGWEDMYLGSESNFLLKELSESAYTKFQKIQTGDSCSL